MSTQTVERRTPTDTFALRLVIARHSRGDLSQVDAAAKCGLKASTWAAWEAGAMPRNMTLVVSQIAAGLDLPREWLAWGGPLRPEGPNNGPDVEVRTAQTLALSGGVSRRTSHLIRPSADLFLLPKSA